MSVSCLETVKGNSEIKFPNVKLQTDKKINDFYEYTERIGHGSNNSVYKVKCKVTGEFFAAKDFSGEDVDQATNYQREILLLSQLKHENIVNCVTIVGGHNPQNLYMIMEYCDTDLATCFDNSRVFNEEEIRSLMFMLFSGLSFLHRQSIIHRDINPTNLLLTASDALKIADFGTAIVWDKSDKSMDPSVGTRWYRAPELLFSCGSYTVSVDMWSAGCVFAELCLQKPLFPGASEMGQISLIIKLLGTPNDQTMPNFSSFPITKDFALVDQQYNTFSQVFKNISSHEKIKLLKNLLTYDFLKRFSAEKCLLSPYFKEISVVPDTLLTDTANL